jgi:hypothetical protein
MTLCILTFDVTTLSMESRYAECQIVIVSLSVVTLSVIMKSVAMLCVVAPFDSLPRKLVMNRCQS